MIERLYRREEYPFDQLAEYGLTEEMILDLPESVHLRLEKGGLSPLLPLRKEQRNGYSLWYSRFVLMDTEYGVQAMFLPELKKLDLIQISEEEKKQLDSGRAIVMNIFPPSENESEENIKPITAFVQVDKKTHQYIYTPSQVVGKNIQSIASEYNLNAEQISSLCQGNIINTMTKSTEEDRLVNLSIGVDLFSENAILVVAGSTTDWEKKVDLDLPEYSFGMDGCWVNNNGVLSYVPEEEFTEDIQEALHEMSKQYNSPENTIEEEFNVYMQENHSRQQSL